MYRWGMVRHVAVALVLVAAVFWVLASARQQDEGFYPGGAYLATSQWLMAHRGDPGVVVVDVREDKHFDGRVIPGAIRLPYSAFQYNDVARGVAGVFVGPAAAQQLLGEAGISRTDTVVFYDSVERDGGATSSFLFWVLDLLGHEKVKILAGGIDGWVAAGGPVEPEARAAEPVLYQAPTEEVRLDRGVTGEFVRSRLGDPHYVVLDVRSPEEYLGEKPNKALGGGPLKPGHVPTAVNVDYRANRAGEETKALKSYPELLDLYRGLDPTRTVIVYCHSGRRGSYAYWVLRLMGFQNLSLYEESWNEWGHPGLFFPVETVERKLAGVEVPRAVRQAMASPRPTVPARGAAPAKGGYVSCGG